MKKSQKGFTLIEIVVAVAILGIIIIPINKLFLSTLKNNTDSRKITIATFLAQDRIEQLKCMSTYELELIEGQKIIEDIISNNHDYKRITLVQKDDINIFRLDVLVYTRGGEAHIVTYLFKE